MYLVKELNLKHDTLKSNILTCNVIINISDVDFTLNPIKKYILSDWPTICDTKMGQDARLTKKLEWYKSDLFIVQLYSPTPSDYVVLCTIKTPVHLICLNSDS